MMSCVRIFCAPPKGVDRIVEPQKMIPKEILKKIRQIELRTKRLVSESTCR